MRKSTIAPILLTGILGVSLLVPSASALVADGNFQITSVNSDDPSITSTVGNLNTDTGTGPVGPTDPGDAENYVVPSTLSMFWGQNPAGGGPRTYSETKWVSGSSPDTSSLFFGSAAPGAGSDWVDKAIELGATVSQGTPRANIRELIITSNGGGSDWRTLYDVPLNGYAAREFSNGFKGLIGNDEVPGKDFGLVDFDYVETQYDDGIRVFDENIDEIREVADMAPNERLWDGYDSYIDVSIPLKISWPNGTSNTTTLTFTITQTAVT